MKLVLIHEDVTVSNVKRVERIISYDPSDQAHADKLYKAILNKEYEKGSLPEGARRAANQVYNDYLSRCNPSQCCLEINGKFSLSANSVRELDRAYNVIVDAFLRGDKVVDIREEAVSDDV